MLATISSRYEYGPFLFFVVAEVMSNYLTTDGLKNFSLLPEAPLRPEARGICHICHMVNPALNRSEVGGEKLELRCWNFVNVVNQFVVCSDQYVLLLVENFLTCSIFL